MMLTSCLSHCPAVWSCGPRSRSTSTVVCRFSPSRWNWSPPTDDQSPGRHPAGVRPEHAALPRVLALAGGPRREHPAPRGTRRRRRGDRPDHLTRRRGRGARRGGRGRSAGAHALLAHAATLAGAGTLAVKDRPGCVGGDALDRFLAPPPRQAERYYLRVPDVAPLLDHLRPVLSARLPRSAWPGPAARPSCRSSASTCA
jgi:hypothetical protein